MSLYGILLEFVSAKDIMLPKVSQIWKLVHKLHG